jgi:uncharacterized membrane protein
MVWLVAASLFLLLSHFGIASSSLRATLARTLGERLYIRLYSVLTLAAFAWLILAYREAPTRVLWITPGLVRSAALLIVPLAFILIVAGLTTPNPTIVGAEKLFDRPDIVRGILRVTRNPFLWGVGLFAIAHVAATGDLASVLFFSALGALGFAGAPILDAKKARRHRAAWPAFAAATSNLPFLAIVQGRQRLVLREIGLWRIALAIGLFVLMLSVHRWAFGTSPLSGL